MAPAPVPPSDDDTATSTTDPHPLTVSLLGPLRATRAGVELALGGRRQRAVLARLALAGGEVVGAERLVDELWAGEPPPSAANTLQSYVSVLRRVLGPGPTGQPVIERVGAGYRLALVGDALATTRFERLLADGGLEALTDGLALWHGPAVADFADEPWAQGDAVRLEELRLSAIEARFDLLLDLGRHAAIVGDLEAATAAHPLRERFTAQLVLALYRCGRQAEALRAFEAARRHLGEELGLDPSPDLVRLADRVLAHDPTLAAPDEAASGSAAVVPDASVAAAPPRAVADVLALDLPPAVAERRARSRFVARGAELGALTDAWAEVVDGDRRMVVLAGEPGMGKTRLAQRFARWVHERDGHVLWGRCTAESLIAYQPAVEALRTAVRSLDPVQVRAVVAPRPALGLLLPDGVADGDAGAGPAGRSERYRLHEAVADLAGELSATAPSLFVIDDVQWADPSTLGLLGHLLRSDRAGRVLVVATVRRPAGRPTAELDELIVDLRRDRLVEVVDVEGLDAEAVGELLATQGVDADAELVRALHGRTGGNPFFVESLAVDGGDLAHADARALPGSVRDLLDQRITALDPAAAQVLAAAAVVGLRVDLGVLADVVGRTADELLDVVDDAVHAGLLVEDEDLGWVTFPHALVRQGLIARTTRNREAQLHLAVADALEARPPEPGHAATVAEHLLAAGRSVDRRRSATAALAAGRAAFHVLADAEARTWARRAVDVLGPVPVEEDADADLRVDADLLIAATSRNLADLDVALAAVDRVADHARRTGDGRLLARSAQEAAQLDAGVGFSFGAVDEALVARLEEALDALPSEHPAERSLLLSWLSIAITGADDQERQVGLSGDAWDLARSLEDRPDVVALGAYARRLALAGPDGLEERRTLGPTMLAAARAAGWVELEVIGLLFTTIDLLEDDRVAESLASLEELRARVGPGGRPMFEVYVHFLDGGFALLHGRLAEAEVHSTNALHIGEAAHGGNATQGWAAQQFLLANHRGTLEGLVPIVADLVERFPSMPAWKAGLATCLVQAGRPEEARAAYAAAFVGDELALRQSPTWYTTVAQLAEVAWNVGDVHLAGQLLPLLEPVADRVAITGMGAICLGHLARHHGLVLGVLGRTDEAISALTVAVARSRACGFEPFLARALVERATLLERRDGPGDREAAQRERAEGTALAEQLGVQLTLDPSGVPSA